MWKRAIVGIGAMLVLAIGIVMVGGAMMPRTHISSSTLFIDAPADSVWSAVADFEGQPQWWGRVERVERTGDAESGEIWTLHMTTGPIALAVESADPPRQLVTRIVADESAPFGGTWTYALSSEGGGTRVTVTEDGFINSVLFRFVSNVIVGLHSTMDSYLRDLATHFGSDVEPEHLR